MAEPNFAHSLPAPDQLDLAGEAESTPLVSELMQLRSLTHSQTDRIHNLEQALDQSLASLREMRQQIVDQQRLEFQLASTEEISNVQQQAIVRLKQQLSEQQETLESQQSALYNHDQTVKALLNQMELLAETQQQEIVRLRTSILRTRSEGQAQRQRLEQQLAELQAALVNQPLSLAAHLQPAQPSLPPPERTIAAPILESTNLSEPTNSPEANSSISRDLETAQRRTIDLEAQIAKQLTTQAMLQHACQELEEERDRQQARLRELEGQTADMQEQILRQAQQASEYETAVQHWKDRFVHSRNRAQQLQKRLTHVSIELPPEVVVLLEQLVEDSSMPEPNQPVAAQNSPNSQLDLPEFLLRRRSYKAQRS